MTLRIARAWAGGNWVFSSSSRLEVFIAGDNGKGKPGERLPGRGGGADAF